MIEIAEYRSELTHKDHSIEDSPIDRDRGSKGAQQSLASNDIDVKAETEGNWDDAVYQSTTANTVPWPTRDWLNETYSLSPEERHELTTVNTVPWSTKDWDNAV